MHMVDMYPRSTHESAYHRQLTLLNNTSSFQEGTTAFMPAADLDETSRTPPAGGPHLWPPQPPEYKCTLCSSAGSDSYASKLCSKRRGDRLAEGTSWLSKFLAATAARMHMHPSPSSFMASPNEIATPMNGAPTEQCSIQQSFNRRDFSNAFSWGSTSAAAYIQSNLDDAMSKYLDQWMGCCRMKL